MDQLLLNRLIFWVICLIFLLVLMYIKKFPKFSMQEKIFTLFILIFILQVVVRTTLLLVHYDLAIGTTKGILHQLPMNLDTIIKNIFVEISINGELKNKMGGIMSALQRIFL